MSVGTYVLASFCNEKLADRFYALFNRRFHAMLQEEAEVHKFARPCDEYYVSLSKTPTGDLLMYIRMFTEGFVAGMDPINGSVHMEWNGL